MEGRLGKYDLLERLAAGGMAELFLARASAQHGFEKTVVLKRILPAFAEQEDFIRMFMAEAQIAAGLHHPNIAQVFDFGEDDGTFYFTMEYVAGCNLRQLLSASRRESASLPLGCALHTIVGVAAGLHHAHEHRGPDNEPLQIVHRDVSPSNVLVTYEGNVKLVDFGIAKAAALGPGTLSGSLKGKIAYMSPEQCRGELVDRRSDIFSLGTLLWELTTGRKLFSSQSSDLALLQKVEKAEITPPSEVAPNYPSELETIVMRALARDRDERFKTALEMRMAIEEFAHTYRVPLTSTRLSSYMDSVFPQGKRRLVSMTSSLPSLRTCGTPLEISAMPSAKLAGGGQTTTLVAAHPNEALVEPPEEEHTTVVDAEPAVDEPSTQAQDSERRAGAPWWLGAAAAILLVGGGGYAWATRTGDAETVAAPMETKSAAAGSTAPSKPAPPPPRRSEPAPVPVPSVAPAAAPEPVEPEPAATPPKTVPKDTADSPAAGRPKSASRRRPKRPPQPARATPTPVEPAESDPPAATKPKRTSDGVFLPTRRKPGETKPGRRKPSGDDFL